MARDKQKKGKRKWWKRILLLLILAFILPMGFAFLSNVIIESNAKNKTYDFTSEIPYNSVGVVLGTAKYRIQGGINPYFRYRIDAAVELFNAKKITYILISGDNSTEYYNEPQTFKDELLKFGIPENRIFLDYAGLRTLDSMIRAKLIFGQSKFTVISQKFHNERAIYLAEHHDIEVIGFNAKDVGVNQGLKTKIREYFARAKAVLDVWFNVEPKYLGEEVEIK